MLVQDNSGDTPQQLGFRTHKLAPHVSAALTRAKLALSCLAQGKLLLLMSSCKSVGVQDGIVCLYKVAVKCLQSFELCRCLPYG